MEYFILNSEFILYYSSSFKPLCKVHDFFPVWSIIVSCNLAKDGGGVICKLHNSLSHMPGDAVMALQGEQKGAEHTGLRVTWKMCVIWDKSCINKYVDPGSSTNLNCFGSVGEEVQYPQRESWTCLLVSWRRLCCMLSSTQWKSFWLLLHSKNIIYR